jgi:oligopeptide/dipeptide ABC transporter ATP-binding protein
MYLKLENVQTSVKQEKEKILCIRNLSVNFYTYAGVVKAIDKINLCIYKEETFGLVGETGCGKSVTASAILRLIEPPGRIVNGEIFFKGENLLEKTEQEMRKIRGNKIAMIFQDPTTYLNPVYTIGDQIAEVIKEHQGQRSKAIIKALTVDVLKLVRMPDPERMINRYPHELSTGMKQRAMIAMMLSCRPELLIADEATTALDVTVQAQILHLLNDLKKKLHLSILFITHNFGVVAAICDRVGVMYAGKMVEIGSIIDIFDNPLHPYTRGLLSAIPKLDQDTQTILKPIPGTVPNLMNPPSGCRFHPRCDQASLKCKIDEPILKEVDEDHYVACHLFS